MVRSSRMLRSDSRAGFSRTRLRVQGGGVVGNAGCCEAMAALALGVLGAQPAGCSRAQRKRKQMGQH